jgi:amino acid permease
MLGDKSPSWVDGEERPAAVDVVEAGEAGEAGVGDESMASVGLFGEVRVVTTASAGRVVVMDEELAMDGDSESSGTHLLPKRSLGWRTVGVIQIGDVVGVGILTMGAAFCQLGWAMAILFLCLMLALNVYTGILLSRSLALLPGSYSYKLMAHYAVGKRWFTALVQFVFYIYVTLALGGYVLQVGQSLAEVFYGTSLCGPIWSAFAVLILLVPLQLRSFGEARWLMWLNSALIFVSVWICLGVMLSNMDAHHAANPGSAVTYVVPPNLDAMTFFNGVSKICFAYLGQYVYLNFASEMRRPQDFGKAFVISAPFQFGMYLAVGVIGYLYGGPAAGDSITMVLNPATESVLLIIACSMLLVHLVISYLIKALVLIRNFHVALSPKTVNSNSFKARFIWFSLSAALVSMTYIVANAIPIFGQLTSLLGALFGPLLGYIFPSIFFIAAHRKAGKPIRTAEKVLLAIIVVFSVVLMVAGTVSNIMSINRAIKAGTPGPFECRMGSYADHFV